MRQVRSWGVKTKKQHVLRIFSLFLQKELKKFKLNLSGLFYSKSNRETIWWIGDLATGLLDQEHRLVESKLPNRQICQIRQECNKAVVMVSCWKLDLKTEMLGLDSAGELNSLGGGRSIWKSQKCS